VKTENTLDYYFLFPASTDLPGVRNTRAGQTNEIDFSKRSSLFWEHDAPAAVIDSCFYQFSRSFIACY
jgi:hypothetical protein